MRIPSSFSQEFLINLLVSVRFIGDELDDFLYNDQSLRNVGANINFGGGRAQAARAFVRALASGGYLDAKLLDSLVAHGKLTGRPQEIEKLRIHLEFKSSPSQVVGVQELEELKRFVFQGDLHEGVSFARFGVVLSCGMIQAAAHVAADKVEQVRAWIDAGNRQEIFPGDSVWLVSLFEHGIKEGGKKNFLEDVLAILAGKGIGDTPGVVLKGSGLERVVRKYGITTGSAAFRAVWAAVEVRVCVVFVDGQGVGTGFLVGPDLILTNHHVMQRAIDGDVSGDKVEFFFDYLEGEEPADSPVYKLKPEKDHWLIDSSEPIAEEVKGKAPPTSSDTSADYLDFALVRLNFTVGDGPNGKPWGTFIALTDFSFSSTSALIILGHPSKSQGGLSL